ncbi:MAG: hypothetical protein V3T20_00465 [Gemmatimonadota bacterium]
MKRLLCLFVVSLVLAAVLAAPAQAAGRFGGGVHYLKTLGDIKDNPDFDENALALLVSYQHAIALFKIEGDVEWILDYGGTGNALIQPQAYLLLGDSFYGGAGIGVGYFDGEWLDDSFYALRVGVNFNLVGLELDTYTLYRFLDTEIFEDFGEQDLNSITFGAQIRF